jgi:hypothetical protein
MGQKTAAVALNEIILRSLGQYLFSPNHGNAHGVAGRATAQIIVRLTL